MPIDFNHTIVPARDSKASAKFVTDVLGLSAPRHWGPFQMVTTANGANLDYKDSQADIPRQHYARSSSARMNSMRSSSASGIEN
ncbi:hypothetical protein CI1B_47300 [Bradyrhizobium ivorense]|uniref:Glyoxalase-like domain-containing protein n=1 Tax=Bradyrhizobium ivorense TaxID=2511166 RepID=A0A508TF78_9BRAD|nr:hypothetical protein [Bradyrhizobium ivorense]VIO73126.1 hypothetical protein CI1B_47300 [Bradyrhizobium ivorense]